MDKEQGQTANPLQRKGFPICPYYAMRAHILGAGPAKRGGRKNPLRHAGSLQRWVHPGHLRPRDHLYAEAGGECGGEFPLQYSLIISAPGSRMGHGLGQTEAAKSYHPRKYIKTDKTAEIL